MRQIVLDTETTGLETREGHRIIEIGCVELVNRRLTGNDFHMYIHPDRDIDVEASNVHGITLADLEGKPQFAEIADELRRYLGDAELIIHNAEFDLGFLNYEFSLLDSGHEPLENRVGVIDTLLEARRMHPGQRNSLDALCKRYGVDNSQRELHGALLDAQILADVYLAMTGGQTAMSLDSNNADSGMQQANLAAVLEKLNGQRPPVVMAKGDEVTAHQQRLEAIQAAADENCLWLELEEAQGHA
ncbi:MAG: DNA polymerase III subunit epsilon [Salinisphaeraceae bacterium]|nr:DNA polymerase III subunit epsilon [Salinisphaeraceae bacterium]